MSDKHTCPRREEDGTHIHRPQFALPTGPNLDTWEVREKDGLRKCSYCGSVHPDDFLARLKAGDALGATDKNYKAYLAYSVGFNKFYFQHFSADQRTEFIGLLNARAVTFDFPGGFTVLPYFIRPAL
jgi:hypothetical protein